MLAASQQTGWPDTRPLCYLLSAEMHFWRDNYNVVTKAGTLQSVTFRRLSADH